MLLYLLGEPVEYCSACYLGLPIALRIAYGGETQIYFESGAELTEDAVIELLFAIHDDDLRDAEMTYNVLPYEVFYVSLPYP